MSESDDTIRHCRCGKPLADPVDTIGVYGFGTGMVRRVPVANTRCAPCAHLDRVAQTYDPDRNLTDDDLEWLARHVDN